MQRLELVEATAHGGDVGIKDPGEDIWPCTRRNGGERGLYVVLGRSVLFREAGHLTREVVKQGAEQMAEAALSRTATLSRTVTRVRARWAALSLIHI